MKRWLVRVALLSYPSSWRRRYGGELEQLMLDCGADATLLGSVWQLIAASGCGLAERLHRVGPRSRALSIICVCSAAAMVIDAETVSATDTVAGPVSPFGAIWLAPNAMLPADANIVHAPAWAFPASSEPVPRKTTVQFLPGTARVVGVSGPPSTIVVNPTSGRITAINPGA